MFDPTLPIYVQLKVTIADAKKLEEILKPLADIYENDTLDALIDLAQQIQQLPSIIDAHEAMMDDDDEDFDGDDGYDFDGIQYPETNLVQNWRMN